MLKGIDGQKLLLLNALHEGSKWFLAFSTMMVVLVVGWGLSCDSPLSAIFTNECEHSLADIVNAVINFLKFW